VTLTGRQLVELLEGQWREEGSRLLQVSDTLRYAYRASAPPGQRIDLASATVRGAPLALDGRYRVTVNSYLAARGVLARGTERTQGMVDLDALERYLATRRPISPPPPGRIRKLD
jgi:5'-nucleotidase